MKLLECTENDLFGLSTYLGYRVIVKRNTAQDRYLQ